jgi:BirA family biotin operon repressor/biotin-[acetyl-CoA-carboxylase] ligase
VVGLAIYRVLRKTGLNLYLKWPNDLISPDREKIGGILIEVIHQDKDILVLVGIGCNLAQSPPEIPSSTDLKSLGGQEITPIEFASALTPIFLEITDTFLNRGFKPFKSEWMEASYVPYEAIKIAQGVDVLTGSWGGVNDRGELVLLNQSQEEITISSGEVVF